jgi:beta-lactamase superfamily II metal-dependent hydrolase
MKKYIILLFFCVKLFSQELSIYTINVGQADACLLLTKDKKVILIDAGGTLNKPTSAKDTIISLLNNLNINHINYLFVSHYDYDHICNITSILSSGIIIDSVFDRGIEDESTTTTYKNYVNAVSNIRNTIKFGQCFNLGNNINFKCISLNGQYNENSFISNLDENSRSLGLLIQVNNFKFYSAGDLDSPVEDSVANYIGNVNAAKISHHGSNTSTSSYFLSKLNPKVVFISVGDNNSYGHPHQQTIERLNNTSSVKTIYQTNLGSGIYSTKVNVYGTIKTEVYEKYFIIDNDTFNLSTSSINKLDQMYNFKLEQNYPNPFNSLTTIEYSICKPYHVILNIYNLLGQKIFNLVDTFNNIGTYKIQWNAKNFSSGIYYYKLIFDENILMRKLLYLK